MRLITDERFRGGPRLSGRAMGNGDPMLGVHLGRQSLTAEPRSRSARLQLFAGPLAGLAAQVVVLAALTSAGVGWVGAVFGLAFGLCVTSLLTRALIVSGSQRLGPANSVTLTRSALIGGVLAMVVSDVGKPVPAVLLVTVGAV